MDLKGANVTTTHMILHVVRTRNTHAIAMSITVHQFGLLPFLFTQICDVNFDANMYM